MNPKYNLKQITSTLEKLFDAGFNTEKKILMMKMEDLSRINNLQSNEPLIIIELKEAIKNEIINSSNETEANPNNLLKYYRHTIINKYST